MLPPSPPTSPIVVPVEVQQSIQQLLTLIASFFSSIAITVVAIATIINLFRSGQIHTAVNSQNEKLLALVEREAYARGAKESPVVHSVTTETKSS